MTQDTVCSLCKGTGIMPKVHNIEEFYKKVEDRSCDQRLDKKIQIKDESIKELKDELKSLQDRLEQEGIYGL